MKQKLLLVLGFMLVTLGLQAEEVSIKFSEQGYANAQEVTECKIGNDVVVTFSKGGNSSTTPKYYNTGTAFRLYAKNTMTIAVPSNATINSVVMTTGEGEYVVNSGSTVTPGALVISGTTATISDINANSVTFTQGGTKGHVRIVTLTVNYTTDENAVVLPAKPTLISSCSFYGEQEVKISCTTDGATIYYTTDGTEPTKESTEYSEPFTVAETTTVKAIAVNENGSSEVATATYTKVELVKATVAEFLAAEVDEVTWYELTGEIISIAKEDYGNFTIKDETGEVYIYGMTSEWVGYNNKSFSKLGLKVGDVVTLGTLRGEYNGTAQGGGNKVPAFYISHVADDDDATDIEAAASENAAPVVYDLLGRRVDNPTSGIYIVNGKKVVIK